MLSLSRLTLPVCGLLITSSAAGAIALHERVTAVTQEPLALSDDELLAQAPQLDLAGPTIAVAREVTPAITAHDPRAFAYVFDINETTYAQLADAPETLAKLPHGKLAFTDIGGELSAVAPLAPADVPEPFRGWLGKKLIVDGNCSTEITGFAIAARLSGDPAYAGIASSRWTADEVLAHGHRVIAAKLASCAGTWARDASLPAPAIGIAVIPPPALAKAALADLFVAKAAIDNVTENGANGDFRTSKDLRVTSRMYIHPRTGERTLYVYATIEGGGCGSLTADLLGVYDVDAHGAPVRRSVTDGVDLDRLDRALDVDGSGQLLLDTTSRMFGEDSRALLAPTGAPVQSSQVPFFGCGC